MIPAEHTAYPRLVEERLPFFLLILRSNRFDLSHGGGDETLVLIVATSPILYGSRARPLTNDGFRSERRGDGWSLWVMKSNTNSTKGPEIARVVRVM